MPPPFVRNRRSLWALWRRAKAFNQTPSQLLGLKPGSPKAFYLDKGMYIWARRIESEMDLAESRIKSKNANNAAKLKAQARNRVLENHLSKWEDPKDSPKRYRDPAAPRKPKTANDIPEGGEIVLGGDNFGRLRSR